MALKINVVDIKRFYIKCIIFFNCIHQAKKMVYNKKTDCRT